jgi:hypothetical protein
MSLKSSDSARGIEDRINRAHCGLAPEAARESHARQLKIQNPLGQKIANG